ncbi:MAG: xylulokinase [Sulfobacillus benefaciens]|jgi:xylulokinase|uniref:Xylulose kinase n=1 Tax=Sulfobacillus benefaciens TaxID=453960 RepID=A0A2T2WUP0_9FIRM|nr:MAG: xylulokinase [Sulfobacillus benefaciens]
MNRHALGIDVGTQGLKGVVIDDRGFVLWSHTSEYETIRPHSGWSEQEPMAWLKAFHDVLDHLSSTSFIKSLKAVGLTGQMHSLVISNDKGEVLRPAILWSDNRSSDYAQVLTERFGIHNLLQYTGNYPLANFSLLRLMWIRDHEPDLFQQIRHASVAKDWLRFMMTGQWGADVSDASGTYLFDVEKRTWATDLMTQLDIPLAWWGKSYESPIVIGELQMGPSEIRGLPVIAGCGDQSASAIGSRLEPGRDVGISIGTSGVIFWPLTSWLPPSHPSIHAFCHAFPNSWHWMGVTQSAAASLRWFRDILGGTLSFSALDTMAAAVKPGSEGISFLPFLQGERSPLMKAESAGQFSGLSSVHETGHLARAIMEGVAFSIRHVWDTINPNNELDPENVIVTGGGAQSSLWLQILADVLGRPIVGMKDPGAAVGAGLLALGTISLPKLGPRTGVNIEPSSNCDCYQNLYASYLNRVKQLTQAGWK